jgi:hypothetical protein
MMFPIGRRKKARSCLPSGDCRGLDARDPAGRWINVEDAPPGNSDVPPLTATLLVGRTLAYHGRALHRGGQHRLSVLIHFARLSPRSERASVDPGKAELLLYIIEGH